MLILSSIDLLTNQTLNFTTRKTDKQIKHEFKNGRNTYHYIEMGEIHTIILVNLTHSKTSSDD